MVSERVKSIVPMFGGATHYVETLDLILYYVDEHHPTTDELVGWHQGAFEQVSSRDSILRRVRYLANVGFLARDNDNGRSVPKVSATSLTVLPTPYWKLCVGATWASEASCMRCRWGPGRSAKSATSNLIRTPSWVGIHRILIWHYSV